MSLKSKTLLINIKFSHLSDALFQSDFGFLLKEMMSSWGTEPPTLWITSGATAANLLKKLFYRRLFLLAGRFGPADHIMASWLEPQNVYS